MSAVASPDFRHKTPPVLCAVLDGNPALEAKWNSLTPLARDAHLAQLQEEVLSDKKRPCCWPGCPHRRESAQKWFKG
jgi:hypothetical protein